MSLVSRFFARNWTLKVSAFGIALLLWVAVRAEAPNRQELTGVPVRVDLLDPTWAVVGDPMPSTVTVRFGGPSRELIRMALERPAVVIPIEEVVSGDTIVLLRSSWVRIQDRPGVVAEDIQPSSIRLTLEPVERASLPAAPRWEGALPEAWALAERPVVDPGELRVSGPRSRLVDLDSIPLLPLDLGAISASGTHSVAIDAAALPVGVQVVPGTVAIDVRVENRVERVVSGIPIVLPGALAGNEWLQLRPQTGTVVLRGARSVVERADPTAFRLMVQLEAGVLPAAGSEADFPLGLVGLPALLEAELRIGSATLRNRSEDGP